LPAAFLGRPASRNLLAGSAAASTCLVSGRTALLSIMIIVERGEVGGFLLVASMFIGAGIGLALGRADVGGAIGLGVGFLLMAFARARGFRGAEVRVPGALTRAALGLAGALLVVFGLLLLVAPSLTYPLFASVAAVAMGLVLVAAALMAK